MRCLSFLRRTPALLSLLLPVDAGAVTFTQDVHRIPGMSAGTETALTTIRLTGPFKAGDSEELRRMLTRLKAAKVDSADRSLATAELSSRGGDVFESLKIGYMFREFRVATLVRKGDVCLSACALAFLGGAAGRSPFDVEPSRTIELGGQVGFHNVAVYYEALHASLEGDRRTVVTEGFDLALGGSSAIIRFAADMAVDPLFVARLLGRPADQYEYIDTAGEFSRLGVCLSEPLLPQASRERQAANLCNNAIRGPNSASPSQARPLTAREARLVLMRHVVSSMTASGSRGRLADQLDAVIAAKRDDLLSELYGNLKAAGVSLPQLSGTVSQVEGYAAGADPMTCMVSFSVSEPDRYDLVVQGPGGLAPPPHSPPSRCRWLFRFDADDVINPRR
jgi:hypothetical protein